jgi:hypothetical protein
MNMTDKEKLTIAQQSIKNLEKRVIELEEQMALVLRGMRKLAESEVKKRGLKPAENIEN